MLRQPREHKEPTDGFYLSLANRLLSATEMQGLLSGWPEEALRRTVLCVIDYYQDMIADAGVWRSFVMMNQTLYGRPVPFFECGDEYVEFELNIQDVRFLIWYSLAMNVEDRRNHNPEADDILKAAEAWYAVLDEMYEEAPTPEGFKHWRELEGDKNSEDMEIYKLSNWLFLNCWLIVPAYALTLSQLFASLTDEQRKDITVIHDRIEQSMMEDPTGPLALYVGEWVNLLIKGEIPYHVKPMPSPGRIHPYYEPFTKATGGDILAFFKDYKSLNEFFIKTLGWNEGEDHLPQIKNSSDFVLMVNKEKGMLLAKNVARCIKHPSNYCYDEQYAKEHAIDLLTVRGLCPADLMKYLCDHSMIPDACFPGGDHKTIAENWDFIARCYLQLYYRGD